MNSRETAFKTDFREQAKNNNDVPVARLIGFELKPLRTDGPLLSSLRDRSMRNLWERCMVAFFAT